ncbi:hypothetical protein WJ968_37215 [Achromobacter xylosoxidans]
MPGEFAWIITLLDPDSGNVHSTNYSERRYGSQDEASSAGKSAVMAYLSDAAPPARLNPRLARVAVMNDPSTAASESGALAVLGALAPWVWSRVW